MRIDLRASEENRARLMIPQVLEVSAHDATDVRFGSINGPRPAQPRLPLSPQERTTSARPAMSVSFQKRKWNGLFDHLIGESKQRSWDGEPQCSSRFQINDEFKTGGLNDR